MNVWNTHKDTEIQLLLVLSDCLFMVSSGGCRESKQEGKGHDQGTGLQAPRAEGGASHPIAARAVHLSQQRSNGAKLRWVTYDKFIWRVRGFRSLLGNSVKLGGRYRISGNWTFFWMRLSRGRRHDAFERNSIYKSPGQDPFNGTLWNYSQWVANKTNGVLEMINRSVVFSQWNCVHAR